MIDLGGVPLDAAELPRLYHELARLGARAQGRAVPWRFRARPEAEELVVLAAQAARQEPRLLWVLVEWLAKGWDRLDPLRTRRALARARWPAALGVALEFARRVAGSAELDDVAAFVLARIAPARGERFFLGARALGGALARRDVEESLAEYRRWGFFSREEPLANELGVAVRGTLDRSARLNLLRRLAERSGSIAIGDYLRALGGRASRRQASRDLATAPFLARSGTTRGARYRLQAHPRSGT